MIIPNHQYIAKFSGRVIRLVLQFLLAIVAGMFSPPLGLLVGIVPLYWHHKERLEKRCRNFLPQFVGVVFAAIACSSRRKFEQSDDFSHYYQNFQDALASHAPSFMYGSGVEVGVPLINYLLGMVFGDLTPWQLMFAHQVIFYGLLIVVLTRIKMDAISKTIFIAFVLAAFPYVLSTQVIRQCYSSIFLFYALSEVVFGRRLIALVIAFFFHVSALPIYLFFAASRTLKGRWFVFFLMGMVFLELKFQGIIEFFLSTEEFVGQGKFSYYAETPEGFVKSDILPVIAYACIAFIIIFRKFISRIWVFDKDEKVVITALFFSLAALPLPLVGLRVCLLVFLFAGAYLITVGQKLSPFLQRVLFVLLIILQMRNMYLSSESSGSALWVDYPAWSFFPGYFFL